MLSRRKNTTGDTGTAAANCNRTPFKSDASCSRGSVAIKQFDDFPICDSFYIPDPDIPPEILETPLDIPVPTPCSCIKINYSMRMGYNKHKSFRGTANFAAAGDDCCEGNYTSEFDLRIPCPITGNGKSKKIAVSLRYGNGATRQTRNYIKANGDKCEIEAEDVSFDLNLPCPVRKVGKRTIKVGVKYGTGAQSVTKDYLDADSSSCKLKVYSPEFDLNIPCPALGKTDPVIKAKVKWGSSAGTTSGHFLKVDPEKCNIEGADVNLDLNLPCPVKKIGAKNRKREPKIRLGIRWGQSGTSAAADFMETNDKACTISGKDVNLELKLPCPVKKNDAKIKIKIGWGSSGHSASAGFMDMNSSSCTVSGKDAEFALNLTCPIKSSGTGGPVERKLKFGKLEYGSPESVSGVFLVEDHDNCTIEGAQPAEFKLVVPCPVKKPMMDFKGSFKYVGLQDSPGLSFDDEREATDAECQRVVKCTVKVPFAVGPFHMQGSTIWYCYMTIGRTLVSGPTSTTVSAIRAPYEGLAIYAKATMVGSDRWTMSVGTCNISAFPKNTLFDVYRLLYVYRNGKWVDCRWMPVVVAAD